MSGEKKRQAQEQRKGEPQIGRGRRTAARPVTLKTHLSMHVDIGVEGMTETFCGRRLALAAPNLRVPKGSEWSYPIEETDEGVIWHEGDIFALEFPIHHEPSLCKVCVDVYNHRIDEERWYQDLEEQEGVCEIDGCGRKISL